MDGRRLDGDTRTSALLRAWLHARWVRDARPDVSARLDLCLLVVLGVLAAMAVL